MSVTPDLSIVTVNFNGLGDTIEMITSIKNSIRSTICEIIVVDNASDNNEALSISQYFREDPLIKTIRSEKNLGFAGGNNLGFEIATAPYIMLLNNDTYVDQDSFHYLIEFLEKEKRAGVVSPKILFADPPNNIQFAGYTPMSKITLRNSLIGFDEPDKGQYNTATRTPYCHGACMVVKREVIDRAGDMPEIYFLYYEELDWCTRISEAGYTLWYEPKATIYHKESRSTGRNSPFRTYYLTRNRLLFAKRNLKGLNIFLSILYQLVLATPKGMLTAALKRDKQTVKAIKLGVTDYFKIKKY